MDEPMLLLLLGSSVAFVCAVLLWKLLITTLGIASAQWAVITGLPDEPVAQVLAFGIPALLAAFALIYVPRIAVRGAALSTARVRLKGVSR
ncbi:hypothetical protein SK571_42425 [Lentzea sp. BCCO 10_0798]|uniref:FtsX-like permease family protein n=1 Tax=Lentzea kristufekii TaxID=3095430 RepID=A0ABU4U667_9PSEU|nr:hypothetical protein [Lentzea sp. BCCO 10_0798]MDX8056073.1 hypothetical protein [Lentzea sp. BCCO 10_0798]